MTEYCEAHYIEYFRQGSEHLVLPVRHVCRKNNAFFLHGVAPEAEPEPLAAPPESGGPYALLASPVELENSQLLLAVGRDIEFLARMGRGDQVAGPELTWQQSYATVTVPKAESDSYIQRWFVDPVLGLLDARLVGTASSRGIDPLTESALNVVTSSSLVEPMARSVRDRLIAGLSQDRLRISIAKLRSELDELDGGVLAGEVQRYLTDLLRNSSMPVQKVISLTESDDPCLAQAAWGAWLSEADTTYAYTRSDPNKTMRQVVIQQRDRRRTIHPAVPNRAVTRSFRRLGVVDFRARANPSSHSNAEWKAALSIDFALAYLAVGDQENAVSAIDRGLSWVLSTARQESLQAEPTFFSNSLASACGELGAFLGGIPGRHRTSVVLREWQMRLRWEFDPRTLGDFVGAPLTGAPILWQSDRRSFSRVSDRENFLKDMDQWWVKTRDNVAKWVWRRHDIDHDFPPKLPDQGPREDYEQAIKYPDISSPRRFLSGPDRPLLAEMALMRPL